MRRVTYYYQVVSFVLYNHPHAMTSFFFFFNDPPPPEISSLPLPASLPFFKKFFRLEFRPARPTKTAQKKTSTDPGAGARSVPRGFSLDEYPRRSGRQIHSDPWRGIG